MNVNNQLKLFYYRATFVISITLYYAMILSYSRATLVGFSIGIFVGKTVGICVGELLGILVGIPVGIFVRVRDGIAEGLKLGINVFNVGTCVLSVGLAVWPKYVGIFDGSNVGILEGIDEGE